MAVIPGFHRFLTKTAEFGRNHPKKADIGLKTAKSAQISQNLAENSISLHVPPDNEGPARMRLIYGGVGGGLATLDALGCRYQPIPTACEPATLPTCEGRASLKSGTHKACSLRGSRASDG